MAIQVIGIADAEVGWAAGADGIYLTTDQGKTWRDITPANLSNEYVSDRIGAMDAVGNQDLWLVLADVPGLAPGSSGSVRGSGIDRSTDGGRTWQFMALPGCLQGCGANLSVSFVDAGHGFASIGDNPSFLFSTDDGGTTWNRVGSPPPLGAINVGGPLPGSQIVFVSPQVGWAVTGPTFGPNDQQSSPGGRIYRSIDGGQSWDPLPGLSPADQYGLPLFFGNGDGLMLRTPQSTSSKAFAVLATHDGGDTWAAHQVPTVNAPRGAKQAVLGLHFTATSPADWKLLVGPALYTTNNFGRSWEQFDPTPRFAPGTVSSVAFFSPTFGMAISLPPGCSSPVSGSQTARCYPALMVTANGGHSWAPQQP